MATVLSHCRLIAVGICAAIVSACSKQNAILPASPMSGAQRASIAAFDVAGATKKVLYAFPNLESGEWPQGPLVRDGSGNLYGSTLGYGSVSGNGSVAFELTPSNGTWTEKVLYQFKESKRVGTRPGPLTTDNDGNLWGATPNGVFELSQTGGVWQGRLVFACHNPLGLGLGLFDGRVTISGKNRFAACYNEVVKLTKAGTAYTATVLHQFSNDIIPNGGFVVDASGDVFGTSQSLGSCCGGPGPTYEFIHSGSSYTYKSFFQTATNYGPVLDASGAIYEVGYTDCAANCSGAAYKAVRSGSGYKLETIDSNVPFATTGPLLDGTGNVYFVDSDVLTELSPSGQSYTKNSVFNFGAKVGYPLGLFWDAAGHIDGTTQYGGTSACGGKGCGTVFQITRNASVSGRMR